MTTILKVIDEHFGTSTPVQRVAADLHLVSERTFAREIIRLRVTAEVDAHNQQRQAPNDGRASRSFVIDLAPDSVEAELNSGPIRHRSRLLDLETEVDRALTAFDRRRYILLVDDRQIEDLDTPIGLRSDSQVVFLYLAPLRGG